MTKKDKLKRGVRGGERFFENGKETNRFDPLSRTVKCDCFCDRSHWVTPRWAVTQRHCAHTGLLSSLWLMQSLHQRRATAAFWVGSFPPVWRENSDEALKVEGEPETTNKSSSWSKPGSVWLQSAASFFFFFLTERVFQRVHHHFVDLQSQVSRSEVNTVEARRYFQRWNKLVLMLILRSVELQLLRDC